MGSTHQNGTSHDQYGPGGDGDLREPPTDGDLRDLLPDGLIDELRWANPVDPEELPSAEDPAAKALLEEILKSGRDE